MTCRTLLVLVLSLSILGVSSLYASPQPSSAGSSVELSPGDYQAILAALSEAKDQLDKSSREIAKQSKQLTMLSISCGVLVVIDLGAVSIAVYEILKK